MNKNATLFLSDISKQEKNERLHLLNSNNIHRCNKINVRNFKTKFLLGFLNCIYKLHALHFKNEKVLRKYI